MENYYNLLEILSSSSSKEIKMAYENKITKFYNIKELNSQQISNIKSLKTALYILTNNKLRKQYDISMGFIKKNNNEPVAGNIDSELNLDSLFKIDNSWMTSNNNTISNSKKQKNEINFNNRLIDISDFNKRPGFSSEFESNLRKPLQGREDKSDQKISNLDFTNNNNNNN